MNRPRGRHVSLIGWYWGRDVVRGGAGLVFLVVALVFGLMVAHMVLSPVEMLIKQAEREGHEVSRDELWGRVVQVGRPLVQWSLGIEVEMGDTGGPRAFGPGQARAGEPWTDYLLVERPALLSIVFLVLMIGMPLLVPLLAFNQLSGDVQSRGLRYVLLRTERGNIYLGRFLGTVAFSIAVLAVMVATIALYAGGKFDLYSAGALARWAVLGFAALAVVVIPYVAVSTCVSGVVDSPFLSLTVSSLLIGGALLGPRLAALAWEPAGKLKYISPWGVQTHLLHPEWSHVLGTAGACLAYAAVFLAIGYWWFDRRDL